MAQETMYSGWTAKREIATPSDSAPGTDNDDNDEDEDEEQVDELGGSTPAPVLSPAKRKAKATVQNIANKRVKASNGMYPPRSVSNSYAATGSGRAGPSRPTLPQPPSFLNAIPRSASGPSLQSNGKHLSQSNGTSSQVRNASATTGPSSRPSTSATPFKTPGVLSLSHSRLGNAVAGPSRSSLSASQPASSSRPLNGSSSARGGKQASASSTTQHAQKKPLIQKKVLDAQRQANASSESTKPVKRTRNERQRQLSSSSSSSPTRNTNKEKRVVHRNSSPPDAEEKGEGIITYLAGTLNGKGKGKEKTKLFYPGSDEEDARRPASTKSSAQASTSHDQVNDKSRPSSTQPINDVRSIFLHAISSDSDDTDLPATTTKATQNGTAAGHSGQPGQSVDLDSDDVVLLHTSQGPLRPQRERSPSLEIIDSDESHPRQGPSALRKKCSKAKGMATQSARRSSSSEVIVLDSDDDELPASAPARRRPKPRPHPVRKSRDSVSPDVINLISDDDVAMTASPRSRVEPEVGTGAAGHKRTPTPPPPTPPRHISPLPDPIHSPLRNVSPPASISRSPSPQTNVVPLPREPTPSIPRILKLSSDISTLAPDTPEPNPEMAQGPAIDREPAELELTFPELEAATPNPEPEVEPMPRTPDPSGQEPEPIAADRSRELPSRLLTPQALNRTQNPPSLSESEVEDTVMAGHSDSESVGEGHVAPTAVSIPDPPLPSAIKPVSTVDPLAASTSPPSDLDLPDMTSIPPQPAAPLKVPSKDDLVDLAALKRTALGKPPSKKKISWLAPSFSNRASSSSASAPHTFHSVVDLRSKMNSTSSSFQTRPKSQGFDTEASRGQLLDLMPASSSSFSNSTRSLTGPSRPPPVASISAPPPNLKSTKSWSTGASIPLPHRGHVVPSRPKPVSSNSLVDALNNMSSVNGITDQTTPPRKNNFKSKGKERVPPSKPARSLSRPMDARRKSLHDTIRQVQTKKFAGLRSLEAQARFKEMVEKKRLPKPGEFAGGARAPQPEAHIEGADHGDTSSGPTGDLKSLSSAAKGKGRAQPDMDELDLDLSTVTESATQAMLVSDTQGLSNLALGNPTPKEANLTEVLLNKDTQGLAALNLDGPSNDMDFDAGTGPTSLGNIADDLLQPDETDESEDEAVFQRRRLFRRLSSDVGSDSSVEPTSVPSSTLSSRAVSPDLYTPSPSPEPEETAGPQYLAGLRVYTWKDVVEQKRVTQPDYRKTKNLPHGLHDAINSRTEYARSQLQMRNIFQIEMKVNVHGVERDAPPVIIENTVDDTPCPPWEFYYTDEIWYDDDVPPPTRKDLVGCDCLGLCVDNPKCACKIRQAEVDSDTESFKEFLYDSNGRLKPEAHGYPIYECNELCRCDDDCRNRVVQRGRKCEVKICKTEHKGWGVFYSGHKRLPAGTFIGIYSGELISFATAEARGRAVYDNWGRTYLYDLDFYHIQQKLKGAMTEEESEQVIITLDAYHAGNFTRFLNHSCDPNCIVQACYVNESDFKKPFMSFFTCKEVQPGEELTFSYIGSSDDGEDGEGDKGDGAVYSKCYCGTSRCRGKLFKISD